MRKTNFIAKTINRPTTKGGTQTMFVTLIIGVLVALGDSYYPDIITPAVIAGIETLLGLIFIYGASREEKPQPQRGITENPPIKRT